MRFSLLVVCAVTLIDFSSSQKFPQKPSFRILAPQFICDENANNSDENGDGNQPGETTIRLQKSAKQKLSYNWTVRHNIITRRLNQRFTLMVWRIVRDLEKSLNEDSTRIAAESVVRINNSALLPGVNYIFNISAVSEHGVLGDTKSFRIDYVRKDLNPSLSLGDASDNLYKVIVLGTEYTFAHLPYVVKVDVTPCQPTNDFYFSWMVRCLEDGSTTSIETIRGSELVISPYTLTGGLSYDISCAIMTISDNKPITKTGIYTTVKIRGAAVHLNIATMYVSLNTTFKILSLVHNYDNVPGPFKYLWSCLADTDQQICDNFESKDEPTLLIEGGLTNLGIFTITVTVSVGSENVNKSCTIITSEEAVPLVDIDLGKRLLNFNEDILIEASVRNLLPGCTLRWSILTSCFNNGSTKCYDELAEIFSSVGDPVSVISVEETFLTELTDYSNGTYQKEYPLSMKADQLNADSMYIARLSVECSCTPSFECIRENATESFADVVFETNGPPILSEVKVHPQSGRAAETMFTWSMSDVADRDTDYPVTYLFKYKIGRTEVLVARYLENFAVSTMLPFVESGITPVVEACDVWGACSSVEGNLISVMPPKYQFNMSFILDTIQKQFQRLELVDFVNTVVVVKLTLDPQDEDSSFLFNVLDIVSNEIRKFKSSYENYENFVRPLLNIMMENIKVFDILPGNFYEALSKMVLAASSVMAEKLKT